MKISRPKRKMWFRPPRKRFAIIPTRCDECERILWWERVWQRYLYREPGIGDLIVTRVTLGRSKAYCDECWPDVYKREIRSATKYDGDLFLLAKNSERVTKSQKETAIELYRRISATLACYDPEVQSAVVCLLNARLVSEGRLFEELIDAVPDDVWDAAIAAITCDEEPTARAVLARWVKAA